MRDCDVEGASDGWDDETVRGSLGVNSWGGVHLQRAHVNAGFFWVRAGIRTAAAMAAVAARLAMAPAWDQLVLNEELHAPALVAPGGQSYGSAGLSDHAMVMAGSALVAPGGQSYGSAGLSDHAMVMAGSAGLSVRVVPLDVFCASRAYFRMASSGGLADSLASVHVNYHCEYSGGYGHCVRASHRALPVVRRCLWDRAQPMAAHLAQHSPSAG